MRGSAGTPAVEAEMRNVDLHLTPEIGLHIRSLRGRFVPQGSRPAPYLDDPRSYSVTVDRGEVAVDLASLNALMSRALVGHSNVRSMEISIDEDGGLRQKGTLKKGVPLPFDVRASVSPTPDGRLRIHSESVRGFGIPVNPLLPPPAMHGRITAVRVEKDTLVQVFGPGGQQALSPPPTSKNYIYWRGGQLSFGKLTMTETDLELIDEDPRDAFDFSVDRWNEQLVAGFSKITPQRGLKAHMPDYNDLPRRKTQ